MNSDILLTVPEVARLTGDSERTVQWKAQTGAYRSEYQESLLGGQGGRIIMIALESLPPTIQVAALRERGQLQTIESDGWEEASEKKRTEAVRKLAILQGFESLAATYGEGRKTEARRDFCKVWNGKHPQEAVSERTLKNWEQAKRLYGRCGLLSDYGKKARKNLIDPEAWNYFRMMYLKQQKRSVADCYRDLLAAAEDYGWRVPSLRRLQQLAKEIPEAAVILQREGPDAFTNKCQSAIKRDWSAVPANHSWMGDHHRLDLFVKNANGRGVTRPWLTAWMDARSWKIVGWQLCWTPSGESILTSFRQGATDEAIGLPHHLYLDNGRDYASKEFAGTGHRTRLSTEGQVRVQTITETLNIGVTFAIPGNARAKTIERFFRTLSEQFAKRFDTYCGSDNKKRPEQLPALLKAGKVPTLAELQTKLEAYIQIYNKTASSGEGREGLAPDQIFQRERGAIRTAPAAALKLCLMRHSQLLKVRMGGIEFMKHRYNNPELIRYRGESVYVRYDDRDMSRIEVFSRNDEWLMTAELVTALPALGATSDQMREANSLRKRELEIARELGQVGILENPLSPLDQLTIRAERAADQVPDPTRPNLLEPVRIPMPLKKAVGQIGSFEDQEERRQQVQSQIMEQINKAPVETGRKIDVISILRNRKGD